MGEAFGGKVLSSIRVSCSTSEHSRVIEHNRLGASPGFAGCWEGTEEVYTI